MLRNTTLQAALLLLTLRSKSWMGQSEIHKGQEPTENPPGTRSSRETEQMRMKNPSADCDPEITGLTADKSITVITRF